MPRHHSLAQFELFILLGLVRRGGEAFGNDLREEISGRTGRGVALGALYASLARLEDRGFVTFEVTEPRSVQGGRARKRFRITRAGTKELQTAVDQMRGMLDDLPVTLTKAVR